MKFSYIEVIWVAIKFDLKGMKNRDWLIDSPIFMIKKYNKEESQTRDMEYNIKQSDITFVVKCNLD